MRNIDAKSLDVLRVISLGPKFGQSHVRIHFVQAPKGGNVDFLVKWHLMPWIYILHDLGYPRD